MLKRPCSDCEALIKGVRAAPHEYMLRTASAGAGTQIYRCLLCNTYLRSRPGELWSVANAPVG
jgi:hypothetical protein